MRYLVSSYIQQIAGATAFPYGTLVVNGLGCFIIGFLSQLAEARGALTNETRALLVVGFLGGFTTFSTFGNETVNFFRAGASLSAFVNISAQLVLGLGAVWLGRGAAELIWK